MNSFVHKMILSFLALIVMTVAFVIGYYGYSYYSLPVEDRFFHDMYQTLKPSGFWGHGFGVFGALFILVGLFSYMARKRLKIFSRLGLLKHWLEFHIFMYTMGPVLVLYHTSFKFGGIVAICFWSMFLVVLSGVIGRFLYLRIPRTIEGRELSLQEVKELSNDLDEELKNKYDISDSLIFSSFNNRKRILREKGLSKDEYKKVRNIIRSELFLTRRIKNLEKMQNLFKYWHVVHLPFALIMLITLVIHVAVVILFGYKWIF